MGGVDLDVDQLSPHPVLPIPHLKAEELEVEQLSLRERAQLGRRHLQVAAAESTGGVPVADTGKQADQLPAVAPNRLDLGLAGTRPHRQPGAQPLAVASQELDGYLAAQTMGPQNQGDPNPLR